LLENQYEVRQNNIKLVEKMTVINSRTGISEEFGGSSLRSKTKKNYEAFRVDSLNYVIRKREYERINNENMLIYNKIKGMKAFLPKAKFDEEYSKSKEKLSRISKKKWIEN
jgi:cobalamin biosynthesis Co2+ chelatase CbiK